MSKKFSRTIDCFSLKNIFMLKVEFCIHVFEHKQILSGIQFKRHFIEFFFVETNQLVGSNANMILARQTCSQCSRRAVESKHQPLFVRICYIFLISKYKGKSIWGYTEHRDRSKQCHCAVATSDLNTCLTAATLVRSRHRQTAFFWQVPKLCANLAWTLLYVLMWVTHSKLVWNDKRLALGLCFSQPCFSDGQGRMFAAPRSRLNYYEPIGSYAHKRIRWNALYTGVLWESMIIREIPYNTFKSWRSSLIFLLVFQ